jgi:hypothetical protein
MKKLSFVLASVMMGMAGVSSAQSTMQDLYPNLTGKSYVEAKKELLLLGAVPIDDKRIQESRGVNDCSIESDICALPEVSACAVDQPLCLMEWHDKQGRRFTVQTSYNASVSVSGLKVDAIFRPDAPL